MQRDEMLERVRSMRAAGAPPKAIARSLGMTTAQVAPFIEAVGAERAELRAEAPVEYWVSDGWSAGLTVEGHPDWSDPGASPGRDGLVQVAAVRERGHNEVSVCGYLLDVYCLGVKDALGPKKLPRRDLEWFLDEYFERFGGQQRAPADLAHHLVLGARDYARGLGFEPHPDFARAAGHLGPWEGPSAITFGRKGRPTFIAGPHDNPRKIIKTLEKTAGSANFDVLAPF
jgi:hypothetical protein